MSLNRHNARALGRAGRQVFAAHRGDLNFTGYGIGYRRRGGVVTDEPAVIAMVVRKRPESSIARMRLLPRTVDIDGHAWGVDVVEAGPLTASGAAASRPATMAPAAGTSGLVRPPALGCGISNVNGGDTGTLGCFVLDPSDQSICLLSTNHVLARWGAASTQAQAGSGEAIIQPGLADGGNAVDSVAFLKNFIPVGSGTNYVDAAIATMIDQVDINTAAVGNLMAAISPSHPALGMVVADDSAACGRNSFLARMDRTVSQLGVTVVGATSSSTAVAVPSASTVGMAIEKVGWTSGYTSTVVDAIGAQVKVNWNGTIVTMSDMIWTQGMSADGDSGAVACLGGSGTTYAPLPPQCTPAGPCGLVSAFGSYYNLPLTTSANLTLADELRDHFLAMSNTGQLLIGVTYLNAQTAIDRLNASTGSAHNQTAARAIAQSLYAQFHDMLAKLITSSSPAAVITASEVNATASILYGLTAPVSAGGTAILTTAESAAAWTLFSGLIKPTVGMGRRQLIDYMNKSATFHKVNSQLAAVPTINMTGPVTAD